jgi:hypothetical protein
MSSLQGAPAFVDAGASNPTIFTPTNIAYVIEWLKAAASVHGLTIDAVGGGWNEKAYVSNSSDRALAVWEC